MKELKEIVRAYDEALAAGKRSALATVVHVEGSSYRRPGARMLVREDGTITGAISGGCLEGDALTKAQGAMLRQQPRLVVYDTTDEDDLKFGVQLGCNGIVSILFEPIDPVAESNPIDLLRQIIGKQEQAVLVTLFSRDARAMQVGTCGCAGRQNSIGLSGDARLQRDAAGAALDGSSTVKEYKDCSALFQVVAPPIQLVIAGAGNDAQPLVAMALLLGWEIVVVDGRASHAVAARFPGATQVVVSKAADVLSHVRPTEQTAFMLMTHNYNYDIALLEQLLGAPCRYIAVLGPKAKTQRMLDELAGRGVSIKGEVLAKIHGPAGLDIGAETAAEIALSILSEIQARFAGRTGDSLKFRPGPIYERAQW